VEQSKLVKRTIEEFPDGRKVTTEEYATEPAPLLRLTPDSARWPDPSVAPLTVGVHTTGDRPGCMFDNLPPGIYGIACPCPRCSTVKCITGGTTTTASHFMWNDFVPYGPGGGTSCTARGSSIGGVAT